MREDESLSLERNFDLALLSYSKSERGKFIKNKVMKSKKILFIYYNSEDFENAQEKTNGILFLENEEKCMLSLFEQIQNRIKLSKQSQFDILIDYTIMPQILYSSLLLYFYNLNLDIQVNLVFSYAQAKFVEPIIDESCHYLFEPLNGFSNISIPTKPTALILGLGFEKRKALNLKEYFDAEEVYIFLTEEKTAPLFNLEVKKQNRDILSSVNKSHIIDYPVLDVSYTRKILFDLCQELSKDFRIVVAPCGPKTFSLACSIVAIQLDNIDIWSIKQENGESKQELASGEISNFVIEYTL